MGGKLILAVGEVLWDLLPGAKQLGGAPANFAYHAAQLGADARLVSAVGDDLFGREIIARLSELGLAVDHVAVQKGRPTGTVSVTVDDRGQPSYVIHEGVAWDYLAVTPPVLELASRADAICFGSLAQRSDVSREAVQLIVDAAGPETIRVFDVNFRQSYYNRDLIDASLERATLLKMNNQEGPLLGKLLEPGGMRGLFERYATLQWVALTRGAEGSTLCARDGTVVEHPGFPVPHLADTIGAGDAFTAALVVGLLHNRPLYDINERANKVAAFVCTQRGATPLLPDELKA
jgi:fructokinase